MTKAGSLAEFRVFTVAGKVAYVTGGFWECELIGPNLVRVGCKVKKIDDMYRFLERCHRRGVVSAEVYRCTKEQLNFFN